MTTKKEHEKRTNKFYCELCDYYSHKKINYDRHILTAKHIRLQNFIKKEQKDFHCELCDFITSKKCNYDRHILTLKHNRLQKRAKKSEKEQIIENNENNLKENNMVKSHEYICECGKKYKHHSSLYNHKNKCLYFNLNTLQGKTKEEICKEDKIDNNNEKFKEDTDYKSLFFDLINENKEMRNILINQQKQLTEIIPKIGNNNIVNNTTNNKNKFNINVFLNEKCKDAISLDDFIRKIEITMKNLIITKDKGQAIGISNIIMENMSKLSVYERPLHCTDKKRETLYIKNNEWEKDDKKEVLNKALKQLESKQLKNVQIWLDNHPNYMNSSKQQDEFAELLKECGKSIEDNKEKIIKNICNEVYIDKDSDPKFSL